jgi:hypothetical protein
MHAMPYNRRRRGERHIPPVPPPLRHAQGETFAAFGYEQFYRSERTNEGLGT